MERNKFKLDYNDTTLDSPETLRILKEGSVIIPKTQIKIFTYNLLSIKVEGYVVIWCTEGSGDKDNFYLQPMIKFLGISIVPAPPVTV